MIHRPKRPHRWFRCPQCESTFCRRTNPGKCSCCGASVRLDWRGTTTDPDDPATLTRTADAIIESGDLSRE